MSETKETALVRHAPARTFSLMPESFGEAKQIAELIAGSDFAPKDYRGKPDNVIIALQMGADLGLKPMQALQNIAIINGRPSIYGDAALALVMPALERFVEYFEGEEGTDGFTAVCVAKRKGWPDETRREFSIADAKAAKLWGKLGRDGQDTPWITYPKRMLQWRARGFTLRDVGSDLLLGLVLVEEAGDYPPQSIEGAVVDSEAVTIQSPMMLLANVPEGLRENIEKAFAELKMSVPQRDGVGWIPTGLGMAKLAEFLGGDGVDPEAGGQALLDWCKDEYAKRKTGQPRAKRGEGNGKTKAQRERDGGAAASDPPGSPTPTADSADAAGPVESAAPVPGAADRPDAGADPKPPVVTVEDALF